MLYRFAPCRRAAQWRWVSPGAAGATALWLAGSMGFSYYVANLGSYNGTFGVLGTVMVMLTWFYLSAFAVLFGAELNAELERQTTRDTTEGPAPPAGPRWNARPRRYVTCALPRWSSRIFRSPRVRWRHIG